MRIWRESIVKRPRLLPIVIVVAASLLVFKAGEVWRGVEPVFAGLGVGEVLAQEPGDEAEAAEDDEGRGGCGRGSRGRGR